MWWRDWNLPTVARYAGVVGLVNVLCNGYKNYKGYNIYMNIIEPKLSPTARKIAEKRYLKTDMDGKIIETPGEMIYRVAHHMAKAEIKWSREWKLLKKGQHWVNNFMNG